MKRILDRAYYALDKKDELLSKVVVPPAKGNNATENKLPTKPKEQVDSEKNSSDKSDQIKNLSTGSPNPSRGTGAWAVQLGAFSNAHAADLLLQKIIELYPDELIDTSPEVSPITTEVGTLFRAKQVGLTEGSAKNLCLKLKEKAQPCIVVEP